MMIPTGSGLVACLLSLFCHNMHFVSAASTSNAASIFNLPVKSGSNYTFALNIPDGSTDLYFHLSGPTSYSWIAVGTGSQMLDSLMIVIYSNADGSNVTVSPRLSSGQQEPVYSSTIALDILDGTGISNNMMTVNARCSNCTGWSAPGSTEFLDLQSTSQPWIFGLGPTGGQVAMLRSNSRSAGMERHSEYGTFNVDMTHATGGSGGLPTSYSTSVGASLSNDGVKNDNNWPSIIHALCACVALILLMPTGVLFLRIAPKSVRWHWINQSLAAGIGIVGIFIGFYLSTMFNKSQKYGSAHQIIGVIILITILAQWGMGLCHHLLYKKHKLPTTFGPIHRYFGYVVFILAIINGGIGLSWSYPSKSVIVGYSIGVLVVGLGLLFFFSWLRYTSWRNQKQYSGSPWEMERFKVSETDSSQWAQNADREGTHDRNHTGYGRL